MDSLDPIEAPDQFARRRSSVASQGADGGQGSDAVAQGDADEPHPVLVRPRRSLPIRALWFAVGIVSLGLGGLGIILPGLPTTPFILLAAFAFLRSSETLHQWLIHSKLFGPILVAWDEHRALPSKRVKIVAVSFTVAVFASSIVYFALFSEYWWASLVLGALCILVCTFLLRLPVVSLQQQQEYAEGMS